MIVADKPADGFVPPQLLLSPESAASQGGDDVMATGAGDGQGGVGPPERGGAHGGRAGRAGGGRRVGQHHGPRQGLREAAAGGGRGELFDFTASSSHKSTGIVIVVFSIDETLCSCISSS